MGAVFALVCYQRCSICTDDSKLGHLRAADLKRDVEFSGLVSWYSCGIATRLPYYVHRDYRRMRTCSMACMRAEGAMRSSSGRPKGYAAASITYSITPHDHTSATCMCTASGRLPCLISMELPHGSSLTYLCKDRIAYTGRCSSFWSDAGNLQI